MAKFREDLSGIYRRLSDVFDYYYAESAHSFQNDTVFDDIFWGVKLALVEAIWPDSEESNLIDQRIEKILSEWMINRNDLRSRGAGMNRESIPILKKKVLNVIEEIDQKVR